LKNYSWHSPEPERRWVAGSGQVINFVVVDDDDVV